MTEDEVKAVVREATLITLEDQSATVTRGDAVLRYGTAERRKALEFCADVIAARVAAQLAGRAGLSAEEREVIEAAKAWRTASAVDASGSTAPWVRTLIRLERAVDRLLGGKP